MSYARVCLTIVGYGVLSGAFPVLRTGFLTSVSRRTMDLLKTSIWKLCKQAHSALLQSIVGLLLNVLVQTISVGQNQIGEALSWSFAARTPLWPFPSITLWSVPELNPLSVRRVGQIIRSLIHLMLLPWESAIGVAVLLALYWSGCAPCLILVNSYYQKLAILTAD